MNRIITIEISEQDYRDMLRHFSAASRMGKPLVAVEAIIDADPDPTDDRPLSPALCAELLTEL